MEHKGSDGVCEIAKRASSSASFEALHSAEEDLGVYFEFRLGIMGDRRLVACWFGVKFLTDAFDMGGDRGNGKGLGEASVGSVVVVIIGCLLCWRDCGGLVMGGPLIVGDSLVECGQVSLLE